MAKTIHQGRNIKHFREILNIKQEGLAMELGDDWNQRRISLLEQKEVIDDDILEQIAKALKVPVESIKNYDVEDAIFNIQNNYDGATLNHSSNYQYNYQPTFNPIDKIVELYEALVKSEREKIDLMQKILDKLK
ncbi:helix-turn-helix domain-containing protein [Chitinophagaceae bacterium LWZ2-11]